MDTIIFVISKLVWALVKPDTWLLLLVCSTGFGLWRGKLLLARVSASLTLVFVLAVGFLPIGQLLLAPLEAEYETEPYVAAPTGIIVLGGAEDIPPAKRWGSVQLNDGAERLTEALRLAKIYPEARLVLSGGVARIGETRDSQATEAGISASFFLSQGIEQSRLVVESRARSTSENARFTFELVAPGPGETWVLVTSAFHMPRAMMSFEQAGWTGLTAWPVDYRSGRFSRDIGWNFSRNLRLLDVAVKERVGLLAYKLLGR